MPPADQLMGLALMLPADATAHEREYQANLAGRLGFMAVHVPLPTGATLPTDELERLGQAADPARVVIDHGDDVIGIVRRCDVDLVRQTRQLLDSQEDSRPLIVAVPISIGRTLNEAVARADRDPRFVGAAHPRESGIFGTFEQAQEQVLALARAGAEVLLVTVPQESDLADVLAQVRALMVGATPALFDR